MKLAIGLACIAVIIIIAIILAATAEINGTRTGNLIRRVQIFFLMAISAYIALLIAVGAAWCLVWLGIVMRERIQWFFEALLTPLGLLL